MTYGRRKANRKQNKTIRLKESDIKKLDIVCMAYDKKAQEIMETAVVNYLNELEEQYIKSVINRKEAI
jgi:predicted transcriptional regulator